MPNIKSAKKRVTVIERRRVENRYVKSTLATYIKKFRAMVIASDFDGAAKFLPTVEAYANSAASKGTIHKNTASRKIARMKIMLDIAKNPSKAPIVVEPKVKKEKTVEIKPEVKAVPAKATATKTATPKAAESKVVKTEKAPAKAEAKPEVKKTVAPKAEAKPAAKPAAKAPAKAETKPATKAETKPAKAPAKKA